MKHENNKTLCALATATGYSVSMLSMIRRGIRPPYGRKGAALARNLGVSLAELRDMDPERRVAIFSMCGYLVKKTGRPRKKN